MRWNCPHCGVTLAVSDEKLNAGWSFSRCYKCGGFALVRRSEVNLIKVDRAPAGEQIILPESSEEPLLSEEASQKLAKYAAKKAPTSSPVIRPAPVRSAAELPIDARGANTANAIAAAMQQASQKPRSQPASLPASAPLALKPQNPMPQENIANRSGPAPENPPQAMDASFGLPEPLPEIPLSSATRSGGVLPIAIGVTALAAVGSGIYLYIQGQALWEKARLTSNVTQKRENTIKPAAVASASAEVIPAPSLISKGELKLAQQNEISDKLRHNAMAPTRAPQDRPENQADANAVNRAPAALTTNNSATDAAANPVKPVQALVVQAKTRNADLHTGPGSLYPLLGIANPAVRYVVADWSDRWFKVIIPETSNANTPKTAWIRTDLVKIVPANADEQIQAYP